MSQLTYLYAIVPWKAGFVEELGGLRGVDGAGVEGLAEGALLALYSTVSSADWGAEVLDGHVRDMEWLAPRATRHQQVLAALHAAAPALLPLPFATLYHQPDAVRDLLRARQAELVAALERLRGMEEWTLKVYQEPAVFEQHVERLSPALHEAMEALRGATPGKAYLLRKQIDTLRREEAARTSLRLAGEIELRIASYARQVVREPIAARPAASGTGARVVLKLALLLERGRRDAIDEQLSSIVDTYAPLGHRFELAGPWPPYSFAGLQSEQAT